MKESNLSREILLAASKDGHRLWLNPRGQGWVGKVKTYLGGVLTLIGARKVTFGVGPDGAGDLLGGAITIVTPDMVGRKIMIFASIEVKTPTGPIREGQPEWCLFVNREGGRAGIVRTVDQALSVLNGRHGASV